MTLSEMNDFVLAITLNSTSCPVFGANNTIGFPGYCANDGPAGVRDVELVNSYASGVSVAASFNAALAYSRGLYLGEEFRAKGSKSCTAPTAIRDVMLSSQVQVALAPVVAPLGRIALGGRNFEGLSADRAWDPQLCICQRAYSLYQSLSVRQARRADRHWSAAECHRQYQALHRLRAGD